MLEGLTGRIVLLDGWRRAGVAVLAGALLTFGLPPFDFPAVGFLSFPVLVWLLDGASPMPGRGFLRGLFPAFRIGWCFGFGYFVGGLWWLGAAMTTEGDAFLWAIPFAVLGLPAVLAIYFGLAAALARALWCQSAVRVLSLAGTFALMEYLRGHLLTGFPWNEIGVLAAPAPFLMQSVSVVGLHGLTLAAVLIFAAPAVLPGGGWSGRAVAGIAAALLLLHVGFGMARLGVKAEANVPDVTLRVVQPNIEQSAKWDESEEERIFARLLQLSRAPEGAGGEGGAGRTLIVWPESAFPFFLTERPDAVARLADAIEPGEMLLAGAARPEVLPGAEPLYFNSVYLIDDNGEILDARDKLHLVPFGEYLPFEDFLKNRLGLRQIVEMPGGFTAGASRKPLAVPGLPPLLPLICYEIIFQDEIDTTSGRPGAILNVTNDAWYGRTPGPWQHLRHAELSAVAFGLPLVRAANTGISVVTDPYGVLREGLALGSAGAIETALPAALPPTIFAVYGNLAFWCGLAACLLAGLVFRLTDARRD
ncbi:apolipoprotein N-acyltransferase [Aureimonas psammosilenae]|uniref:apolipoprotein N-acyltransferase n=1 Tax=Aureimonas psammosilenae TaxID=2495496 RepID=UPI001260E530|nr:apolipoprotein N-acyltransferase [Aureimonas psammosilenae]